MIIISKAKISDATQIRQLETKIWQEEVVSKYDAPCFIRFGWCFVAKNNDKIIGAICSYLTKENKVYVCDWVVDKLYRRKNIGLKLYNKLIKETKGHDIIALIDTKNEPSIEAHTRIGFKPYKHLKNAYNLNGGLDSGNQILMKLKNSK